MQKRYLESKKQPNPKFIMELDESDDDQQSEIYESHHTNENYDINYHNGTNLYKPKQTGEVSMPPSRTNIQYTTLNLSNPAFNLTNQQKFPQRSQMTAEIKKLKAINTNLEAVIYELKFQQEQQKSQLREQEAYLQQFQIHHEKLDRLNHQLKKNQKELREAQIVNSNLQAQLSNVKEEIEQKETSKTYQMAQTVKSLSQEFIRKVQHFKMKPELEESIENFIEELIKTVESKTDKTDIISYTGFRGQQTKMENGYQSVYSSKPILQSKRSNYLSYKPQESKGIHQLQKSLHKLRDMEKSYDDLSQKMLKTPDMNESNLSRSNSMIGLDRSLVMGLDRSKSRRKRIFD